MSEIVIFQNDATEEPGAILAWAAERGHRTQLVRAFGRAALPENFSHAIVLGAPLGVADISQHAWLEREADLLRRCLRPGGPRLLGICFGAQLIAHLLGAKVEAGAEAEVGWHELMLVPSGERLTLFQWHRDCFSLPSGAKAVAGSAATPVQGFRWENALALAGHPEITPTLVNAYVKRFWSEEWYAREAAGGSTNYVQRPETILAEAKERVAASREAIWRLLDGWEKT